MQTLTKALAYMTFLPVVVLAKEALIQPPPAKAAIVVRAIRYEGALGANEARFAAELDVESLTKTEASIPLFEGDVAVMTTKLPPGLELAREGKQYRLVARRAGRYKFKLDLVAKITRIEPWNQISFTGPEAAIASITAQASDAAMEVQLLSGTALESDQKAKATVHGFLGPERTVALRWQSRAAEIARKVLMTCETSASVQITPTVIKYTTQLRFDIVQGSLPRLVVKMPATHALTRLEGDQVRDWKISTEGSAQELTVELIKPAEKSYRLTLFTEQTIESATASVSLVASQPQDVERESGSLTVSAEDVLVETESLTGLRQVNAPEGMLGAYQFSTRPALLALKLRRIEPVINVADLVTARLEETRLLVTHALTLNVEKAGIYALELSPQAGFAVADVSGDGIEDWKTTGGRLMVNFSSRVLGTRPLKVQLEQALKTFPEQINLSALRITGATKETAQIGAASAAGIQLKTDELVGVREMPVTALAARSDEALAYQADAPDWKLTLGATKLSSYVVAEVFNLITIGDGLVSGSASIRYAILNQGIQQLRVKLPAHWKNVEFTGANIRRKDHDPEKDSGQAWTIGLQEKAWGGYTLLVTYDYEFDPHQAALSLGGAHVLDVERETGTVAITSASSLQLKEIKAGEPLRRIDEFELAESDRALIANPVLLAYRYDGRDYGLQVSVNRFDELPVLEAVADRTQLTTVLTEQGQMLTQASFMVKNNDKQFQTFTLPAGAEFWSCYVAGQPVKPERNGEEVLVPLPRGANRDQAFAVEIVYAQKIGSLKSALPRSVKLDAPGTDMQATYAEWELFAPLTHHLARFGGNMVVARGTTYGLRDAWRRFTEFYGKVLMLGGGFSLVVFALLLAFVVLVGAAIRRGWRGVLTWATAFLVLGMLLVMALPALKWGLQQVTIIGKLSGGDEMLEGAPISAMPARAPIAPAPSVVLSPAPTAIASLNQKLNSIIIPEINFRDAVVPDIVRFLSDESRRVDPQHEGVNIVLQSPDVEGRTVTLSLRDVPLVEALKYVTTVAGLKFRVEPSAVLVLPKDAPEGDLLTRSYPVAPGSLETLVVKPDTAGFRIGAAMTNALGTTITGVTAGDVKTFFTDAGVPFPAGATVAYNGRTGTIIVRNTPENLEIFDRILGTLNVATATATAPSWGVMALATTPAEGAMIAAGPMLPVVAGIRPIRIEIPRTGQRFVFTKVLNVGGEPLQVRSVAMKAKAFRAARAGLQVTAFLAGLILLWWQLRWRAPAQPSSLVVTVAVALILGSVFSLLIAARLLHWVFILALPVLMLAVMVWLAARLWRRPVPKTEEEPPPAGETGVPPVAAAIALLLFVAGNAQAEPGGVVIESASYVGTVGERVAQFEATIQLSAKSANQSVRLFGEEVAIQDVAGPKVKTGGFLSFISSGAGAEPKLVREGKFVSVSLPRAGSAAVRLRFLVKLSGDVARRQLAFGIPPALFSTVTATIDEPEASVDMPTAVSLKTFPDPAKAGQTRVEAIIGAGERVELTWTPRMKRAAEIAATVFCQNAALASFGGGALNVRSVLDYQVTQGELRQLRVRLPADYRLMRVEGESIRTWKLDGQMLAVELIKGVSPSYRLTVETERILDAPPASVNVETPHAVDVKRETGLIALRASEELSLSVDAATELQKVDSQEFDRVLPAVAGKNVRAISAYRFFKPEFELSVRVEAMQPQVEAVVRNRIRVGTEQIDVTGTLDYVIKRAGVFVLKAALPAGYRVSNVDGKNITQWVEKTEEGTRVLEVILKERTMGNYSLRVDLMQLVTELPKTLEIVGVHPLGTQKLTGFVSVSSEEGVQLKSDSFDGLTEVPPATIAGEQQGVLAYKFIPTDSPSIRPDWKLAVATELIEPAVQAEVVNLINVTETLVSGRAVVRYRIESAPVKTFRLKVPESLQNVQITGNNIRQRDHEGARWIVELQNKVHGSYTLTVTWDKPWALKDGALEAVGVTIEGVERETGSIAITAKPPLQIALKSATDDLLRIDARELPDWAGRSDQTPTLAYRYLRPGYKLVLSAQRYEEAEVLQALVDNVRLTSVISEDGQMMTEMALSVRNNARQNLEIALPGSSKVWSAFVAGQPVRPTNRDGKVLVPMQRSGSDDAPVMVELIYVSRADFPRVRGRVALESPALDVPLKNAQWDLYVPPEYRCGDFEGTMTREPEAEPVYQSFTQSSYSQMEGEREAQRRSEVQSVLRKGRSELAGGKVKEAHEMIGRYAYSVDDEASKRELKQLEEDVTRAQGGNVMARQKDFLLLNAPAQQAIQMGQGDHRVAEQQWLKLSAAQQLGRTKVMPLRVTLPAHGLRHSLTQVLQTEVGVPMTIGFSAVNTRAMSWPVRIALGGFGFVLLWLAVAGVLNRKAA